ncbi:hypothetical protein Pcinc_014761 [Petrolisthes cinctipes]|uniref:Transposase Tc1-like domain-containing protein n=1 Tax=Petrolisthes cinctipes TaxID=88211 RepID=A0AAE1KSY2_PETCI|nr:hypothetical protein Pcinc_014761 [Petrolisthes cinctipes]
MRQTDNGTTTNNPQSGRPRCTTADQDRAITSAISANPSSTTTTIRAQQNLSCSAQTIRNRFYQSGRHGRRPAYKPELTECNMEHRMEYALLYADKPPSFWNTVIFCDEKTFSTDDDWMSWHPDIKVLPHHPKSPDQNPIEHIWAAMTRRCAQNNDNQRSRSALIRNALTAWEELSKPEGQALTQSVVASMPSRLNSVLDEGGGHTKY